MQLLKKRKKVLGEDHPHTLASMENLAETYRNQGRRKEAEELDVQVMENFKKKLGADHPDSLVSINNYAYTLKGQGRYTEAIKLMQDCVELCERTLGVNHSRFLAYTRTLAQWQAQGMVVALSFGWPVMRR